MKSPRTLRPWLVLDVDGVLNNHHAIQSTRNHQALDPICLSQFHRLQDLSNARGVILSSTWRLFKDNFKVLNDNGIFWEFRTPDLCNIKSDAGIFVGVPRRTEINATLTVVDPDRKHPVIVLDDDSDADLRSKGALFVHTNMKHGLQAHHVDAALAWLDEQESLWAQTFTS